MQTLSDDARFSTQLEGKKLKGFGARFGKIAAQVASSLGLNSSVGLDEERGIIAEEIIFDDVGREVEERKKREVIIAANQQDKKMQKLFSNKRHSKKEAELEEKAELRTEATEHKENAQKLDIEAKHDKVVVETIDGARVKLEALKTQEEIKIPPVVDVAAAKFFGTEGKNQQVQQPQNSPAAGIMDFAKMLLTAILPTQVPDVREGHAKGQGQGQQL